VASLSINKGAAKQEEKKIEQERAPKK